MTQSRRMEMKQTKACIEKLQAEACLVFLSALDGRKYKLLGDRLDSQSQKSAPDFAFCDECSNCVGAVEITSSAEYQNPRTKEDDFKFEAIFDTIKNKIESIPLTNFGCDWSYELVVTSPCVNFLDKPNWNIFFNALINAIKELEEEGRKYKEDYIGPRNRLPFICCFNGLKNEFTQFTLCRKELAAIPKLSAYSGARWTSPPDYEGLKKALDHINEKFERYKGGARVGLIDVFNWPAAEHVNPQNLVGLKGKYANIDRLFLIQLAWSERTNPQPKHWHRFGRYELMKVW